MGKRNAVYIKDLVLSAAPNMYIYMNDSKKEFNGKIPSDSQRTKMCYGSVIF